MSNVSYRSTVERVGMNMILREWCDSHFGLDAKIFSAQKSTARDEQGSSSASTGVTKMRVIDSLSVTASKLGQYSQVHAKIVGMAEICR